MARLPFGEGPEHRAVAAVLRDDAAFLKRDQILTEATDLDSGNLLNRCGRQRDHLSLRLGRKTRFQ